MYSSVDQSNSNDGRCCSLLSKRALLDVVFGQSFVIENWLANLPVCELLLGALSCKSAPTNTSANRPVNGHVNSSRPPHSIRRQPSSGELAERSTVFGHFFVGGIDDLAG